MDAPDPSQIILGCGNFGGIGSLPELIGHGDSAVQALQILDQARDFGIYKFDTANSYGGGQSEEILGEWIRMQSPADRRRFEISTKVGNPFGASKGHAPLSRREVTFQLQKSLIKLGVEQIKTYYLHEPDLATPISKTLRALEEALKYGDIEFIGLSNVDLKYVKTFLKNCDLKTRKAIKFVQNEFHYLKPNDAGDLIPYLASQEISYVAFSPLAGGLLSGKYLAGKNPEPGSRLHLRPEPYQKFQSLSSQIKIQKFLTLAKACRQTPQASALKFILETKGIDAVVIGPRRKEHFENFGFKCTSPAIVAQPTA